MSFRIGHGYDIHRLVPDRPFILGGVEIPSSCGFLGHSDGDVLAHAVIDALLGAAGLNDIGTHFPDTDERWRGASGELLVRSTLELLQGYRIVHLDTTVITEQPRLGPHRDAIRTALAGMLDLDVDSVNFKAKTNEGCGPIGEGVAAASHAVVLLEDVRGSAMEHDRWL